ncbi:uncharacterized protein LOC122735974 isoform X1 [Dromiciops gliroides]|uniref:uncharacterized protein LOC122735974 isoform X1 n=1 Tax=Dromiciops gliroides TaxID=33562 RepID=UPI001CC76CB4|nr:uncharacterized protein LOC122735974 isoform X1 [Dromiciops gliroides]
MEWPIPQMIWVGFLLSFLGSWAQAFLIHNPGLDACLQVDPQGGEQISLVTCHPDAGPQQWGWDPVSRALFSLHVPGCLAIGEAREFAVAQLSHCGNHLHQTWGCSRKGHLSLQGLGLHLHGQLNAQEIFVLRRKDKFSRWKAVPGMANVCSETLGPGGREKSPEKEPIMHRGESYAETTAFLERNEEELSSWDSVQTANVTPSSYLSHTASPTGVEGPQMAERGANWKTVMMVLGPLTVVLGVTILILNICYNRKRKKKTLSALENCSQNGPKATLLPKGELSLGQGGPGTPNLPISLCPSLQHGEILIEWKDGSITPLFDSPGHLND